MLFMMLVKGCIAWGVDASFEVWQRSGPLMIAIAVSSTISGIGAGLIAPYFSGYPRACLLGTFFILPILSLVFVDGKSGSFQAVDPGILVPALVGGMIAGALFRWQYAKDAWPVGDNWP